MVHGVRPQQALDVRLQEEEDDAPIASSFWHLVLRDEAVWRMKTNNIERLGNQGVLDAPEM